MSNLNTVQLQGNLVDDPKIVGKENNVARFTLAVNTGYGEKRVASFIDCVAFGKQVEVIAKHLTKGKQVIVNGRLSQNRWEDESGNKRSRIEVHLNQFDGFFFTGNMEKSEEQEPASTPSKEKRTTKKPVEESDGKLF